MGSYLTSKTWRSVSLRPWASTAAEETGAEASSGAATDAELGALPAHEAGALEKLRGEVGGLFEARWDKLSSVDGWQAFREGGTAGSSELDEMLLRVLRYNLLNVARASVQVGRTLEWRCVDRVCAKSLDVLDGASVGLPTAPVRFCKRGRELLVVCISEAYVRRDVDHQKQSVGIAKIFDHLFYDRDGPLAKKVTAVVDFTNMSTKNVDLVGMRNGINVYMSHFPEIFHRVFLLNYPRFIHGGKLWHDFEMVL